MPVVLERRAFLKQAVIAGFVIGFPWPRSDGDEAPSPSPLAQARAEMARRGVGGVLFVVADPDGIVIAQLNGLFGGTPETGRRVPPAIEPRPELLRLFARSVFVCAPAAEVERAFGAEAARAMVVRLDVAGNAAEFVNSTPDLVSKGWDEVLLPRLVSMLDGPDGRDLEAAAAHQRAAFPALATDADVAIAGLEAPAFPAREAASKALLDLCDRQGNVLELAARRTTSLEARTRIEGVLLAYVLRLGALPAGGSLEGGEEGGRLVVPYGAQWELRAFDPCPGCGRGSASRPVRRYISLVAVKGK